MNLILWIMFGALVGWIGSILMNATTESEGIKIVALGILGGVLGGWISTAVAGTPTSNFDIYSICTAVVGAILVLVIRAQVRTDGKGN